MAYNIAVAGKGGTGKTSLTGILIDYLTKEKKGETLVVDVLDKTRHKNIEIPLSAVAKAQTMVKF